MNNQNYFIEKRGNYRQQPPTSPINNYTNDLPPFRYSFTNHTNPNRASQFDTYNFNPQRHISSSSNPRPPQTVLPPRGMHSLRAPIAVRSPRGAPRAVHLPRGVAPLARPRGVAPPRTVPRAQGVAGQLKESVIDLTSPAVAKGPSNCDRVVLIDGQNVAYYHPSMPQGATVFSWYNMKACVDVCLKSGYKPLIILKQFRLSTTT